MGKKEKKEVNSGKKSKEAKKAAKKREKEAMEAAKKLEDKHRKDAKMADPKKEKKAKKDKPKKIADPKKEKKSKKFKKEKKTKRDKKREVIEVRSNIFLLFQLKKLVFEVENGTSQAISFVLDLEGSVNISIKNGEGLRVQKSVGPCETVQLCKLEHIGSPVSIQRRCDVLLEADADTSSAEGDSIEDAKLLDSIREVAKTKVLGAESNTRSDVEEICLSLGINYVDRDFPAVETSLWKRKPPGALCSWRRPIDFFEGPFEVFADDIEPDDIRQGQLGDCWLLSSLAACSEFPALIRRLFVEGSDCPSESGVYCLRIMKNGSWQRVMVDDYFPCYPKRGPICSSAHGKELWVMLLEKAYAKVHGGYHNLVGGNPKAALQDLLGFPTEQFFLENDGKDGSLWATLVESDAADCVMTSSTLGGIPDAKRLGLAAGHAYTLLGVHQSGKHRLVHLRNPWGRFEWTGPWSDDDSRWTEALKKEVDFFDGDDGAFWMSYHDWLQYFEMVTICHTECQVEERRSNCFEFAPEEEFSFRSEQYKLTIDPGEGGGTMWVTIHQDDERVSASPAYIDCGFSVLKRGKKGVECTAFSGLHIERETAVKFTAEAGAEYFVVPITSATKLSAVSDEARATASPVFVWSTKDQKFTEKAVVAWKEIFRRLDRDMDELLRPGELNRYSMLAYGHPMEHEEMLRIVSTYDARDRCLTCEGFIAMHAALFKKEKLAHIWQILKRFRYNEELELVGARKFAVSFHCDCGFSEQTLRFDRDLLAESLQVCALSKGVPVLSSGEAAVLRLHFGRAYLFAAKNSSKKACRAKVDLSGSVGYDSHLGSLLCEKILRPNSVSILQLLAPQERHRSCTMSCRTSLKEEE